MSSSHNAPRSPVGSKRRRSNEVTIVRLSERQKTIDDLPAPGTKRWVTRRKAEVVAGVHSGLITAEQACERYNLSMEEFNSWRELAEHHGVRGLRTTRIQEYRNSGPHGRDEAQR